MPDNVPTVSDVPKISDAVREKIGAQSQENGRMNSVGDPTSPTGDTMTTIREIDPVLNSVIENYAEMIIERTLMIVGKPNTYSITEHQLAAATLDSILESYSKDAAKLDEITGRNRLKAVPTTNEIRAWLKREPLAEADYYDNLTREETFRMRIADDADKIASLEQRVLVAERDVRRLDELEQLFRAGRLRATAAIKTLREEADASLSRDNPKEK